MNNTYKPGAGNSQISFQQSAKLDVSDAFYEHLVYENLECIVQKYIQLQQEQNQRALKELEDKSGGDEARLRDNNSMNESLKQ